MATFLGVRGLEISSRVQLALLGFGLVVLAVFAVVAFVKVAAGSAGNLALTPSWTWFDPFKVTGTGSLSAGLLLTIYLFWGWDGGAAVLQSRAWDEAGYVQPTRAQVVAERGETTQVPPVTAFPSQHYNGITTWAIDRSGEVKHVYA